MSIEKFSGQFKNESRGCTVLINETIQSIKDFSVLGLYAYLCSKPETWEPNVLEIMRHTGYSKQKTYRLITALLSVGLMTKVAIRNKGRFTHFQYTIHLHPQGISPVPKKQEVEIQEVENEDAYKTKNFTKQRTIEKKELPPLSPKGEECVFESFWNLYPSKKAKKKCEEIWKRRKLDLIAVEIIAKLQVQRQKDDQWIRGFIPNPTTYLNQDRWNDEISVSQEIKEKLMRGEMRTETPEEKIRRYAQERDKLKLKLNSK